MKNPNFRQPRVKDFLFKNENEKKQGRIPTGGTSEAEILRYTSSILIWKINLKTGRIVMCCMCF